MTEIPRRMRDIQNANGFEEFLEHLKRFMGINNFPHHEQQAVLHLLNSFYMMGLDIENYLPQADGSYKKKQEV